MNRNNFWVHFGIAVVVIAFAAVIGQIDRWRAGLRVQDTTPVRTTPKAPATTRSAADSEPEVLVRFKPGVSEADIKRIASRSNDRVEDEIESVGGLVAIDDLLIHGRDQGTIEQMADGQRVSIRLLASFGKAQAHIHSPRFSPDRYRPGDIGPSA